LPPPTNCGERRALARVARALLAVRLLAAAAHELTRLGGVRARPLGGLLRLDHLPEEMLLDLGAEDGVGQIHLAHLLPLDVDDVDLHGLTS
jgi:hypothetical protein